MGVMTPARKLIIPGLDCTAWVLGLMISCWFRAEFDATQISLSGLIRISVVAVASQLIVGIGLHTYRGRYWIGSFDEALNLARVTVFVGIAVFALDLFVAQPWVPRSVPLTATLITLSIAAAARLVIRRHNEHRTRPTGTSTQRVIIFGAGAAGKQLVCSILRLRCQRYPVSPKEGE